MAVYYITHRTSVGDPKVMKIYSSKVNGTFKRFGGRKIVRTSEIEVIEGNWNPDRMTIIEFPDIKSLKAWYDSSEYADLKEMRHSVMSSNAIVVKGI